MECPNCSFQNTPTMKVCVRCQSPLELATVDYLPPRASGGVVKRAVKSSARRQAFDVLERHGRLRAWVQRRLASSVDWPTLARSILPGYGHLRVGRRRTGWTLLGVWWGLLLGILLAAGSGWAWVFWLLALGLHCGLISVLLAPAPQGTRLLFRMATGLLVYLVLCAVLYLPARWLTGQVVRPFRVDGIHSGAVLADGDTVLYTGPWLRGKEWNRGDLVLYRIQPATAAGLAIRAGFGLDRIVGITGDQVDLVDGVLTVNGSAVPPEHAPIGDVERLPELSIRVPGCAVVILPSTFPFAGYGNYQQQIPRAAGLVSMVYEQDIEGRVFWRLRPWSELGPME